MFFKAVLYAGVALGSATLGQQLIHFTRQFIAGEQALAHIDPYATAQAQNVQIAAALAQVNPAPQP